MTTAELFAFPHPVNEISARIVAGTVAVLATLTIVFDLPWMTAVIAYGFLARALTGPTLSPLGQIVTRVITPRLPVAPRLVAGPPKRFAQAIGATLSSAAAVLALGFGEVGSAYVLLSMVIVAATLESAFAFCLGCKLFAALIRLGAIPERVCERCVSVAT